MKVKQYPEIPDEAYHFEKSTDYEVLPEELGDEEIVKRLGAVREKAMAQDEKIVEIKTACVYQIYHKLFLSPNKDMTQNVMWTNGMIMGLIPKGEEMKMAFDSCSGCGGMEILDDMETKIPPLVQKLNDLATSEPITPGEYDCICAPDVTGMIVHEAFGHGVEMDMFSEKTCAGRKIHWRICGIPISYHAMTVLQQHLRPQRFFFDDEGTLAQDTVIIDKGILKTGICDAQAAMALGTKPTGNGRREKNSHKAYTRMTNTFFEPGTDKVEDMISSISYGFYLENASSGMEDPKNWGIQCLVDIAREIKDGKFTGKVFSPIVLTGYVPDLLKSISMMSDECELAGTGYCGKGHKEWVKVSDGGPYIKARIRLG